MHGLDNNPKTNRGFDKFHDLCMKDVYKQVTVLGICQFRKSRRFDGKDEQDVGQLICGATALRARTDSKIYLRCVSDDDPRRIVFAKTRDGVDLPKHYLEFDPNTRRSELGMTVRDAYRQQCANTEGEISENLTKFLVEHPQATEEAIQLSVDGNYDTKRRLLKRGVAIGSYKREGKGKRKSPYLYSVDEVQTEGKLAA